MSSDICNFGCEDGFADTIDESETEVAFPSPTTGLILGTGNQEGGFGQDKSFGRARSSPFFVTWQTLGWEQIAESRDQILTVEIFSPVGGFVGKVDVDPSEGAWASGAIDISSACGEELGVEITGMLDQGGWDAQYITIWDDIEMGGVPCPQYVDADGDGVCLEGLDLDGDGNCAGDGEPDSDVNDCDDNDAAIFPGAVDVGGNGVDENCDGVDEDADSTDPGSTDPGTNMPTGDDDDDDSQDASEGLIAAGGAGCACDSGGASPVGLLVFLGLLALRRR